MKRLRGFLLSIFLGLSLGMGCATTIRTAPPPPRREVIPSPPGSKYVWVSGHWKWTRHGWKWAPGHYVIKPRPAAAWVPGHWKKVRGGWKWVPGHWR